MRRCWIIKDWICYVEQDEIPLEVCKLCVEARLRLAELKMVKRNGESERET